MAKLSVYNMKKEAVGEIELNDLVFNAEYNEALIHQVIVALHNNARQGTKSALTRSEVNATKKKLYRQKGTGGARHDERSAPQFDGGGVVFAPKSRDFSKKMNVMARRTALFSALSKKVADNEFFVIDDLAVETGKTKEMVEFLKAFNLNKTVLVVLNEHESLVKRAARNLEKVDTITACLLNTYDVVKNAVVVIDKKAVEYLNAFYGPDAEEGNE